MSQITSIVLSTMTTPSNPQALGVNREDWKDHEHAEQPQSKDACEADAGAQLERSHAVVLGHGGALKREGGGSAAVA
jgi:hypothetical protein